MNTDNPCFKVCIIDSSKLLEKVGIKNICARYGSIRNINFCKNQKDNTSYVEFEDQFASHKLLNDQSGLPDYLTVNLIYDEEKKCKENPKIIENCEDIENPKSMKIDEDLCYKQSHYFRSNVSMNSLIEESKQLKLNGKIKSYNLENDNLFGKPVISKWEKFEMPEFELMNPSFVKRFENSTGGEIKIEKKLGPSIFTGWAIIFNDGENVKNILKTISDDIESSDVLNISSLERGMLVGAFDNVTSWYGRGYVILVAGNSVNVAMCDFGRVINTTNIRALPEKHTKKPAYSFKVFTKDQIVSQLKEKSYIFKVRSASLERIVLTILVDDIEIKAQLKIWQPSVEEFGIPYIDFKSGSFVEILKLKDMNSVYLRSKEKHHFEFLFKAWNLLSLYCSKNSQFLNRVPNYGEIVGFKSIKIENFARGRIHKYLGDDVYCVKHLDFPLKENIKLSEMIELQFEHKIMPVSYIKVGLKDALHYPIIFEARRLAELIIGVRLIMEYDESKLEGWKYVDLQVKILKENFNKILFNLVEPSWLKSEKIKSCSELANEYCTHLDLLRNKLEVNSVVNMTFVMLDFDRGVFYMRDKAFGKSYTLLSNMIAEYCSLNLHSYLPHAGELCLGKFSDGMWYRVICDDLRPGQLVKVHSVDLGDIAYLNSNNMRKLPEELLFHPSHVYVCHLRTFTEDFNSAPKVELSKFKLLEKYENTDVEFTVIQDWKDENDYLIKCPLFEDLLV